MSTNAPATQTQAPPPATLDPAASLKTLLEKSQKEIAAALPKHVTPERMMRIALTEARKNPALLRCDRASFLGAVIQASQLGLEPGHALGHCYLIPHKNNKKGIDEVQFMIGYRGMLDLVRRSGLYSHVIARLVCKGDEFTYEFGLNEKLTHKPAANAGDISHVYAIAFPKDGGKPIFDVMEVAEVDAVRKGSKASENGPWVTHYPEMAKKTVIRRLFKYLPATAEMQKAITLDELADAGVSQGNGSVIETTGKVVNERSAALEAVAAGVKSETPPQPEPVAETGQPGDFQFFDDSP